MLTISKQTKGTHKLRRIQQLCCGGRSILNSKNMAVTCLENHWTIRQSKRHRRCKTIRLRRIQQGRESIRLEWFLSCPEVSAMWLIHRITLDSHRHNIGQWNGAWIIYDKLIHFHALRWCMCVFVVETIKNHVKDTKNTFFGRVPGKSLNVPAGQETQSVEDEPPDRNINGLVSQNT